MRSLLLLLCFALAACSNHRGTPISSAGGTVESRDGRAKLVFPPGAVTDPIDVELVALEALPGGQAFLPGTAWELFPDGARFNLPVELSVKVDDPPASELVLFKAWPDGQVSQLETTFDADAKVARASTMGFSIYAAAPCLIDGEGPNTCLRTPELTTDYEADRSITLSWTSPTRRDMPIDLVIERVVNNDLTLDAADAGFALYTSVRTTGRGSYRDYGVGPRAAIYHYRVRAARGQLTGPWSNVDREAVFGVTSAPPAPARLSAIPGANVTVNLTWEGVPSATHYVLERKAPAGAFTVIGPAPGGTFHTDTGLTPTTLYEYRIKAVNDVGESAWVSASATTGAVGGSGGSWVQVGDAVSPPGTLVSQPVMAFDAATNPVVGWLEQTMPDTFLFRVRRFNGAAWVDLGGPIASNPGRIPRYPAIASNARGDLAVSWAEEVVGVNETRVATWDGAQWSLIGLAATRQPSCSVKLDAVGTVYVACASGTVAVVRWTGSLWESVGPAQLPDTPQTPYRALLQFDASGVPSLIYAGFMTSVISVHRFDAAASSWGTQLGGAGVNTPIAAPNPGLSGFDFALDGNGRPVVLWGRGTFPATTLAGRRWNGAAWVDLPQLAGTSQLAPVSMALLPDDRALVGFIENYRSVQVKVLENGAWRSYGGPVSTMGTASELVLGAPGGQAYVAYAVSQPMAGSAIVVKRYVP